MPEWLSKSESDFFTPAVDAEIDGDELMSISLSAADRAAALLGSVVDLGSPASEARSSLVSGTLERRFDDMRVMASRSHAGSSSSPLWASATLLSMALLATGDVDSRTSLLADRSRSLSLAMRTASRSSRLGSENFDE